MMGKGRLIEAIIVEIIREMPRHQMPGHYEVRIDQDRNERDTLEVVIANPLQRAGHPFYVRAEDMSRVGGDPVHMRNVDLSA